MRNLFVVLGGALFALILTGAASSNRTVVADFIRTIGGAKAIWTVPNGGNDTVAGLATTQTLTNKTMDTATNTFTGLANSAVASGAAIDFSKLHSLTAAHVLVGSVSNVATDVAVSGDIAISNAGATSYNGVVPVNRGGTANGSLSVTNGGVLYTDGSVVQNVGSGFTSQILMGGFPPHWGNNTMTKTILTTTGATTGYWFNISSGSATLNSTYTNNGHTFTTLATVASGTRIWMSGALAPAASGTLTKSTGTGDATLTFSGSTPLATYSAPSTALLIKIYITGGGGSGGGVTSSASNAAGGGGGMGGDTCIKYVVAPFISTDFFYSIGTGGAASSSVGNSGILSSFTGVNGTLTMVAGGGDHASAGIATTLGFTSGSTEVAFPTSSGCDLVVNGSAGTDGIVLNGTAQACGGRGGGTFWTGTGASQCDSSVAGSDGKANTGQGSGGGVQINNGGAKNSGAAAGGVLLVEEFY